MGKSICSVIPLISNNFWWIVSLSLSPIHICLLQSTWNSIDNVFLNKQLLQRYKWVVVAAVIVVLQTMEAGVYDRVAEYLMLIARTELLTCTATQTSFGRIKEQANQVFYCDEMSRLTCVFPRDNNWHFHFTEFPQILKKIGGYNRYFSLISYFFSIYIFFN